MPIIRKANPKCPKKECRTEIKKEWNIGVLPRLLSMGIIFFKCRKCNSILQVNMPMYIMEKFLDAMPSDPSYRDGEFIDTKEKITKEEEEMFIDMIKNQPEELFQILQSIENINLDNYK